MKDLIEHLNHRIEALEKELKNKTDLLEQAKDLIKELHETLETALKQ